MFIVLQIYDLTSGVISNFEKTKTLWGSKKKQKKTTNIIILTILDHGCNIDPEFISKIKIDKINRFL